MILLGPSLIGTTTPVTFSLSPQGQALFVALDLSNETSVTVKVSVGTQVYFHPPQTTVRYPLGGYEQSVIITPLSAPAIAGSVNAVAYTEQDYIPTQVARGANPLATTVSLPVGVIEMYGGAVAPSGWLLCDGSAVSRSVYNDLFTLIGTTFGVGDGVTTFNVPNFTNRSPMGVGGTVGLGATAGAATVTLGTGEIPAHNHGVTDPTHSHSITDPTHGHTASQPAHNHGVNDPTHGHTVTDSGHAHTPLDGGAGGGFVYFTGATLGFDAIAPGGIYNYAVGNTAAGFANVTAGASATSVTIQNTTPSVTVNAGSTGVTVDAAATSVTTNNTGGSGAHNNLHPVLGISFIIKATSA